MAIVTMIFLILCQLVSSHTVTSMKVTSDSSTFISTHHGISSFSVAKDVCIRKGLSFSLDNTEEQTLTIYRHMVELAKSLDVASFWIPIQKVQLDRFTFLNDSIFSGEFLNHGPCSFIDVHSPQLRTGKCSNLWLGFICTVNESDCFPSHVNTKHVKADGICFQISLEKVNWFEARMKCYKTGGQLATLDYAKHGLKLSQMIWKEFSIFRLHYFWIGMRNVDFRHEGQAKFINEVFWGYQQPNISDNADCVVARVDSNKGYYWETENCAKKHNVICIQKDPPKTEATTSTISTVYKTFLADGMKNTTPTMEQKENKLRTDMKSTGTLNSHVILPQSIWALIGGFVLALATVGGLWCVLRCKDKIQICQPVKIPSPEQQGLTHQKR